MVALFEFGHGIGIAFHGRLIAYGGSAGGGEKWGEELAKRVTEVAGTAAHTIQEVPVVELLPSEARDVSIPFVGYVVHLFAHAGGQLFVCQCQLWV